MSRNDLSHTLSRCALQQQERPPGGGVEAGLETSNTRHPADGVPSSAHAVCGSQFYWIIDSELSWFGYHSCTVHIA